MKPAKTKWPSGFSPSGNPAPEIVHLEIINWDMLENDGVIPEAFALPSSPEKRLIVAVMAFALDDARRGSFRARDWWRGKQLTHRFDAARCCEAIGADYPAVLRRLESAWRGECTHPRFRVSSGSSGHKMRRTEEPFTPPRQLTWDDVVKHQYLVGNVVPRLAVVRRVNAGTMA